MPRKTPTTRGAAPHRAAVPAAEAAEAAAVPIIIVPQGQTLEVVVEVGPMVVPYTVAYASRTIIKSLVNRAEVLTISTGDFVLGWAFAHTTKGWSHTIGYSLNGGPVKILESKSEAKKDPDHSVAFALIRA